MKAIGYMDFNVEAKKAVIAYEWKGSYGERGTGGNVGETHKSPMKK